MKLLRNIYLFLAVVFFAVGVVQCVRWARGGSVTVGYLLNFLPSATFAAAHLAGRHSRSLAHAVAIVIGIPSILLMAFIGLGVEMWLDATRVVTDVAQYEEVLDGYWSFDPKLVGHFPRPIPADARDVRFSFAPAFLQGGAHVQLRYAATPEAVSRLYAEYSAKKTKSFLGGDTNVHMNTEEGMPTTFFYTGSAKELDFPDDYEIMIFDEVLKEEDRPPGFYWNHGKSHGVAISKERNEIIYWAEAW